LSKHINKTPHNTVASLVEKIKDVMGNLDRETVQDLLPVSVPGFRRGWRQMAIFLNIMVYNAHDFFVFT
jgi:hypothetical protein